MERLRQQIHPAPGHDIIAWKYEQTQSESQQTSVKTRYCSSALLTLSKRWQNIFKIMNPFFYVFFFFCNLTQTKVDEYSMPVFLIIEVEQQNIMESILRSRI